MQCFASVAVVCSLLVSRCQGAYSMDNGHTAQSVEKGDLNTCSKPGTALTGFTRDGHCQDLGDDDGVSHHICIQMKPDFCRQTGQPNWCEEKMPCMGQDGECKNWQLVRLPVGLCEVHT